MLFDFNLDLKFSGVLLKTLAIYKLIHSFEEKRFLYSIEKMTKEDRDQEKA
jgi:hypothetical protein